MKSNVLILIPVVVLVIWQAVSCSSSKDEQVLDHTNIIEFAGEVNAPGPEISNNDEEIRVYPLPTPLQMTSILKAYDIEYHEDHLLPVDNRTFTTNVKRALNLGMLTINIGYTAIYNKNQKSLDYIDATSSLMEDMGLRSAYKDNLFKRFEANINDSDSLSYILLESYEFAHTHYQSNHKEGMGLLILTGCYLEGLYLITHLDPYIEQQIMGNLIGQQKLFLESIIELLTYYNNAEEIKELTTDLKVIQTSLDHVSVMFDDKDRHLKTDLQQEDFTDLKVKITAVRHKIRS